MWQTMSADAAKRPHPADVLALALSWELGDPRPRGHLKELTLFRRGPLQTLNHQPAAFVVLDVCANLACHTGVPKEVEVIVLGRGQRRTNEETPGQGPRAVVACSLPVPSYLNLKELPHLQQDLLGIGMLLLPIDARLQ